VTHAQPRHRRPPDPASAGRRRNTTLLLAALLTGACGAFATSTGSAAVPPAAAASPAAAAPAAVTPSPPGRPDDSGLPAHIDIADIGVSADVEPVVRNADGTLATPQNWNDAGWYAEGVVPGEPGPAVIVGHRDSAADGAAVFYRLGELAPGADVTITERDGSTGHFVVDSLQQVAKSNFPTEQVYGPSAHRLLRLITCIGDFDFDARSYVDNLVVTAHAV
jgi:sortase (surface protein transpeptidase)